MIRMFKFDSGEVINLDHVVSIGPSYKKEIVVYKTRKVRGLFTTNEQEYPEIVGYHDVFDIRFVNNSGYKSTYFANQRDALINNFGA